ncbi:hypothetical protein B0T24DRAFT_629710 [Lasiosphaeria ovina]|uniref:Chromo domain-containing protein n=1 Tax=Lasiosphaeria ovina TaxID=92902 RepID=A0AAE0K8J1_9PEZI|nr:hypothetical protein B0T24DRAFT_629710 [Lasiosphaeria ovina]
MKRSANPEFPSSHISGKIVIAGDFISPVSPFSCLPPAKISSIMPIGFMKRGGHRPVFTRHPAHVAEQPRDITKAHHTAEQPRQSTKSRLKQSGTRRLRSALRSQVPITDLVSASSTLLRFILEDPDDVPYSLVKFQVQNGERQAWIYETDIQAICPDLVWSFWDGNRDQMILGQGGYTEFYQIQKVYAVHGSRCYVEWVGYEHPTWEPTSNIPDWLLN